jgi:hypothetical protein
LADKYKTSPGTVKRGGAFAVAVDELTKDAETHAAHIRIEALAMIGKLCPAIKPTERKGMGGRGNETSSEREQVLPPPRLTEATKLAKLPEPLACRVCSQPPVRTRRDQKAPSVFPQS